MVGCVCVIFFLTNTCLDPGPPLDTLKNELFWMVGKKKDNQEKNKIQISIWEVKKNTRRRRVRKKKSQKEKNGPER